MGAECTVRPAPKHWSVLGVAAGLAVPVPLPLAASMGAGVGKSFEMQAGMATLPAAFRRLAFKGLPIVRRWERPMLGAAAFGALAIALCVPWCQVLGAAAARRPA